MILEWIKGGLAVPSGILSFEDPPLHNIHRNLLARMFTPRKVTALEEKIRQFCSRSLDPLVGTGDSTLSRSWRADADAGDRMFSASPMATWSPSGIGRMRHEDGIRQPMKLSARGIQQLGSVFADYVDWRAEHPSDDIMTELLNVEFEDETGATRRLRRDELLLYINVVAQAGNETTTRLIGWAGKVLGEHPDQRRDLVDNPGLIPQAIEELVRSSLLLRTPRVMSPAMSTTTA